MKKILTFLCAIMVVFGTSAAPRRLHKPLNKDAQRLEQRLKNAKTVQERDEMMLKYKLTHRSVVAQKHVAKAPKARRAEAAKVSVDRVSSLVMYDEEKGFCVYYGLHQEEENGNKHFFFRFPLAEGQHDVVLTKSYSLADMDAEDCAWDQGEEDEDWNTISYAYKSATFVKTVGSGFDYHIRATVTDINDQVFEISYDEAAVVPTGEVVDVTFNKVMDASRDFKGQWLVRSQDNKCFVQLAFYGPEAIAGTYTGEAISLSESYVQFPTDEVDEWDEPVYKSVYVKDGSITVTEADGRTDLSARLLCEDGVTYNVTMFYETPKAKSHETIEANNLYIDTWSFEYFGELAIYGGDVEGTNIGLSLYKENPEEGFLGTYVIDGEGRNSGHVTVDHESYDLYSGTVTVAQENGQYVVTGTVLAWNNVEYTIRITEPDVVVTPMNFSSDQMVIDLYKYQGESWFEVAGFDPAHEQYLLLTVLSDHVAGTYTEGNLDQDYTYFAIGENTYSVLSANLTVEYTEPQAKVTGTILLVNTANEYDHVELTVDVTAKPYEPSERNVTIGAFSREYVQVETEDGETVYALYYQLLSEDRQQLFGFLFGTTQWVADVEFGKTYTTADMYNGSRGQNAYEREYIMYSTVQFTKTATANGVKIAAKVVDTRGNVWNLTYEGDDVAPATPFDVRLGQANKMGHGENALEYEMVDVDNTFKCVLVIPVEEGAEDVENDRTYTSTDDEINLVDSYLSILGEEHQVTAASFHKEWYGDQVQVDATVYDERGYSYRLFFYDDGFRPTGETVHVVIDAAPSVYYDEEDASWRVYAEDDAHVISLQLMDTEGETPVGEYDASKIITWSSRIEVITGQDDDGYPISDYIGIKEAYSVTISGEADNYTIHALFMGEDGNEYDVYVNTLPTGIDQIADGQSSNGKYMIDGVLYIVRDGKLFNAKGVQVRSIGKR